jgi:hypothetical protein
MEVSYGTRRIATKYNDVPPARCIRDVGHYGRLVFAMVARHFLSEGDLIALLQNPDINDHEARSLYLQVQGKDYNPPRRERILQWQKEQSFPICPTPEDPDSCDGLKDLKFPPEVYEHIAGYYEGKVESQR